MPAPTPSNAPIQALGQARYWRRTQRLTAGLLALWFVVTFGFGFFAGELNFSLFGWPFSFWMAAQGALAVYCAIVWFYAWQMNRQDERFREEAKEGAGEAEQ